MRLACVGITYQVRALWIGDQKLGLTSRVLWQLSVTAKIPEINLKWGKYCFGERFQRFWAVVGWLC